LSAIAIKENLNSRTTMMMIRERRSEAAQGAAQGKRERRRSKAAPGAAQGKRERRRSKAAPGAAQGKRERRRSKVQEQTIPLKACYRS
jgi:hypothetical protein